MRLEIFKYLNPDDRIHVRSVCKTLRFDVDLGLGHNIHLTNTMEYESMRFLQYARINGLTIRQDFSWCNETILKRLVLLKCKEKVPFLTKFTCQNPSLSLKFTNNVLSQCTNLTEMLFFEITPALRNRKPVLRTCFPNLRKLMLSSTQGTPVPNFQYILESISAPSLLHFFLNINRYGVSIVEVTKLTFDFIGVDLYIYIFLNS